MTRITLKRRDRRRKYPLPAWEGGLGMRALDQGRLCPSKKGREPGSGEEWKRGVVSLEKRTELWKRSRAFTEAS